MASSTAFNRSLYALLAFLAICQILFPLVAAEPAPKKPKGSNSNKNNTADDDESMAAFGAAPDGTLMVGMSFLAFLASRFF